MTGRRDGVMRHWTRRGDVMEIFRNGGDESH